MANVMGIDPCDSQNHAIFNATTQKRNYVDPRTGLFEVYVPLPSITGNAGSGPVVDMSLFYTPVVNNFAALGDGWSFAFTTYHEDKQQLTLHSGEVIKVEKGKEVKTPAVIAKWDKADKTATVLTVERRDGRVETLKQAGSSKIWVPARLTTDGYNFLDLTWIATPQLVDNKQYYQIQLVSIKDANRQLLKVEYALEKPEAATVKVTFWPDDATEKLCFTLALKDYALRSVTAPDGNKSTFDYLNHASCGWLLELITTFDGLVEKVEYQDIGLVFKGKEVVWGNQEKNAGQVAVDVLTGGGSLARAALQPIGVKEVEDVKLSALPCVSEHTLTPLRGGVAVRTNYTYKRVDEKKYSTLVERRGVTTYTYDEKHEVAKEEYKRNDCALTKLFSLEESDGLLVRKISTEYLEGKKSRKEEVKNVISSDGALLYNVQNGVRSDFLYKSGVANSRYKNFDAEDGDGAFLAIASILTRVLISDWKIWWLNGGDSNWETHYPDLVKTFFRSNKYDGFGDSYARVECIGGGDGRPLSNGPDDVRQAILKANVYVDIKGLNRKKPSQILQVLNAGPSVASAVVVSQKIEYFEDDDFRKGRQKSIAQGRVSKLGNGESLRNGGTLQYDNLKTTLFDYKLDGTSLTTTTTEASGRSCSETHSILSGRLLSQVDADGNKTTYEYDAFGRLTARTTCAQSATYKQITRYAYPSAGRLEITEPSGQQRASEYDGQDQLVNEYVRDSADKGWRQTLAVDYDEYGRKKRITQYDYLGDGTQIEESLNISYDDWGQELSRTYDNGLVVFSQYDPITMSRIEWTADKDTTDASDPAKHYCKVTTYQEGGNIAKEEWKDSDNKVYQTEETTYTNAGHVATLTARGVHGVHTITYTRDGAGRVLREQHEEKGLGQNDKALTYTYCYTYPTNPLISEATSIEIECDGKKRKLGERSFDGSGRVTSLTRAGITESFTYSGSNRVPATKKTADGKMLAYEYIKELGNRVSKIREEGGTAEKTFTYAQGAVRNATAKEGERSLEFQHDLHGRLKKQRAQLSKDVGMTMETQYSEQGRLLSEKDATGAAVAYEYKGQGSNRSETVDDDVSTHHHYTLGWLRSEGTAQGKLEVQVSRTYDDVHRETSRRFYQDYAFDPVHPENNKRPENAFDLTVARNYFPDGRLKSIELKDGKTVLGSRAFTYTPGARLASCTTTGVWRPKNPKGKLIDKQVFAYDALGNVTSCTTSFGKETCTSTYSYDTASGCRLEKIEHDHADYTSTATLSYDKAGRLVQDQTGKKYQYDWLGRLAQAGSRYYTYDPMDRLMACGPKDAQYQVLYSGLQVRGEYKADAATTEAAKGATSYSGRHLAAGSAACTVQRVRRAGAKRTLFELRDVDGTVLITYDPDAKTLQHHAYTAYGEHTSTEPDSLLGFNGEYRDTDGDQYPLGQGYRWYAPGRLQFHAPDVLSPFGEGGPHAYGYCGGDPANYLDRSGHTVGAGAVNRGLRRIWGDSLPGPIGLGRHGALISTIIWSGIGVLTAIATGGTSLLLQAAVVGLAAAASATAITAVVIEDTNPELAKILGWVSLGVTVAGGAASRIVQLARALGRIAKAVAQKIAAVVQRSMAIVQRSIVRGGLAGFRAGEAYRPSSSSLDFRTPGEVAEALAPVNLTPVASRLGEWAMTRAHAVTLGFRPGALTRLWSETLGKLEIGDVNNVVCAVTGVLGNAGYFESENDAFINGQVNNFTWLPWGSFNVGRYL